MENIDRNSLVRFFKSVTIQKLNDEMLRQRRIMNTYMTDLPSKKSNDGYHTQLEEYFYFMKMQIYLYQSDSFTAIKDNGEYVISDECIKMMCTPEFDIINRCTNIIRESVFGTSCTTRPDIIPMFNSDKFFAENMTYDNTKTLADMIFPGEYAKINADSFRRMASSYDYSEDMINWTQCPMDLGKIRYDAVAYRKHKN